MPYLRDTADAFTNHLDVVADDDEDYIRAFQSISTRIEHEAQATTSVEIPPQYREFANVFEKMEFDRLPPHRRWDHEINLRSGWENDRKLRGKVYPLSPREQVAMNDFLDENLATGRIRPSNSPIASPLFFVGKKDGGLQPTMDYRRLNSHTVRDSYPLPLVADVMTKIKDAKYFSKFDVHWGYNNIRIRPGDEFKAAFITSRGLFEPTVMFFGMSNSPATFQRMVDNIFGDLIRRVVLIIYMDDLLVFTRSLEDHRKAVRAVLELCRQTGLYLKLEKCEFGKQEVRFLGLVIGHGEVTMDPVKVEAVRRWPTPRTLREVQSFMQFCNFYRNFIPNFARITKPFNRLTEKNVPFSWGPTEEKAFAELRDAVCDDITLMLPQDRAPFRLETDASEYAASGVLHQIIDGKPRPLGFFSKSFNAAERNYEIYDKEMIAVMWCLQHWRHHLMGAPSFEIWTDHRNLQYFREPQKVNRRQARWLTELAEYEFTMHHRPGRTNIIADELSRKGKPKGGVKDNTDVVLLPADHFRRLADGYNAHLDLVIRQLGADDDEHIMEEIRKQSAKRDESVKSSLASKHKDFVETNGIVKYKGRVYVPRDSRLRERIVRAFHDTPVAGHPGRHGTRELIERHYWWSSITAFVRRYVDGCDICQRVKPRHGPLAVPLYPNDPPARPWEVVSVDIIGPLPESHGYNTILVVVDRHTKLVIACPTHVTLTSEGAARLYLNHVFKRFGLPMKWISDRGPQFISSFARDLHKLLGPEATPSTAYHPQTDGQTERENAKIEKYLWAWGNTRQDDWSKWLPLAEFAINNRVSSATGSSSFFQDPRKPVQM
ncbi:DNA/RNA polymerase [Auricularia subglabra TFB-10046 SS5]|nr:DNA/RNA polymerase [Auricularia subglabra TFB-10046 SS5]